MADLGSIGFARGYGYEVFAVVGGQIKLRTLDPSSVAVRRVVRAYRRSDGALVGSRLSDNSGEATMFVNPFDKLAEFDIHALDDDAGTDLADVFFSRVVATTV